MLTTLGNVLTYTDTAVTNGNTYYYKVSAVNSIGESALSGEANAMPAASKTMSVSVTTDKATYSRGNTVHTTVTVKDSTSGNPLQGASVTVRIYNPSGTLASTTSGTTSSSGTVQLTYRLGFFSATGTYKDVATVTLSGYSSGTGQTTFAVH